MPIPYGQNKCKIILMSQSIMMCHTRGTTIRLLKVDTLNDSHVWIFFMNKVGRNLDHDSFTFNQHYRAIVRKCGGLSIALEIMGHTMTDLCQIKIGGC